jgi:polysaccharide biosynthesis/export protein
MRSKLLSLRTAAAALIAVVFFTACRDTRQLAYFENKLDATTVNTINAPEAIIQKGDILNIVVYSDNPSATAIYNQPIVAPTISNNATGPTSTGTMTGYEVDQDGNILFQGLGPLKVEGLTKKQLVQLLDSKLKDSVLKNPYYSIRFVNLKISIVGEVKQPGTISLPHERINILQAVSLAGDFTDFARRDSILIIRESLDKRTMVNIDLTKTDILSSPDYFLQHNDVVVIRPIKKKYVATDQVTQRNLAIATSILSTAAIIVNTIVIISRN